MNRIPPGGYSIAEKGYKNRINRVYDATRGEGNATKANISESSETSHPRAIALERIPTRDFLANSSERLISVIRISEALKFANVRRLFFFLIDNVK